MPKPAMVFEGKARGIFLCVSKAENGGLDLFAQEEFGGALVSLSLKEVRELAAYLVEHLQAVDQKISPPRKDFS
jgi:hypothetical protein